MHRMRLPHEVDGDRTEHVGPGSADICLPALPESSAARHRKHSDGGVGSAKEALIAVADGLSMGRSWQQVAHRHAHQVVLLDH